jgi:hypothetical protein
MEWFAAKRRGRLMVAEESNQDKTTGETTNAQAGGESEVWRERTYTGTLMLVTFVFIGFLSHHDLRRGDRILALAFGMESNFWLTVFPLIGLMLSFYFSFEIAVRAYLYEVVKTYGQEPLSPFASGVYDICFWSSFLFNAVFFYLFARFIAPGSLGSLRPYLLLAAPIIPSCILAVIVVRRTVRALYGRPSPRRSSVNS